MQRSPCGNPLICIWHPESRLPCIQPLLMSCPPGFALSLRLTAQLLVTAPALGTEQTSGQLSKGSHHVQGHNWWVQQRPWANRLPLKDKLRLRAWRMVQLTSKAHVNWQSWVAGSGHCSPFRFRDMRDRKNPEAVPVPPGSLGSSSPISWASSVPGRSMSRVMLLTTSSVKTSGFSCRSFSTKKSGLKMMGWPRREGSLQMTKLQMVSLRTEKGESQTLPPDSLRQLQPPCSLDRIQKIAAGMRAASALLSPLSQQCRGPAVPLA